LVVIGTCDWLVIGWLVVGEWFHLVSTHNT